VKVVEMGEEDPSQIWIRSKRRSKSHPQFYQTIRAAKEMKEQNKPPTRIPSTDRATFSFNRTNDNYFSKPLTATQLKRSKGVDFMLKFVDMGNACYLDEHFSDIIQTREYRSPEVILGIDYDQTADVWSLACMLFELFTGDYLFDPRKGKTYGKGDDHLALISELVGECKEKNWLLSGEKSKKFFTPNGKLKRIKNLKLWPVKNVLMEKYALKEFEADMFSNFIDCMLQWRPRDRARPRELLKHNFLKMQPSYNFQMSREQHQKFRREKNVSKSSSSSHSNCSSSEGSSSSDEDGEELDDDDQEDDSGRPDEYSGPEDEEGGEDESDGDHGMVGQ
jgi:serine/threonine-protein kinase SRPK3